MQIKNHKEACQTLSEIGKTPYKYLTIHYSCESFFNLNNGLSPRIVSIAIRNLETEQTDSFSIHKIAEQKGIPLEKINQHYDELELQMLEKYMEYIKHHHNFFFIHWNMRDDNFGFGAIAHRFTVLKNKNNSPIELQQIPDTNKINLSFLLIKKYGDKYIEDPRMEKLIKKNNILPKYFLTGKEEAAAFDNQEYVKLHLSTLSKTRVFATILSLACNSTLKTNSSWLQRYARSPKAFCKHHKEGIVFWLITTALGLVITYWSVIKSWFGP